MNKGWDNWTNHRTSPGRLSSGKEKGTLEETVQRVRRRAGNIRATWRILICIMRVVGAIKGFSDMWNQNETDV